MNAFAWLLNLGKPRLAALPPAPSAPRTIERTDWRGFAAVSTKRLAAILPEQAHDLAGAFLAAAEEYDLNPLFLAAISRHETAGWTSYAYRVKRNAMGVSDASGPVFFKSTAESILSMARSLARPTGHYRNCRTLGDVWMVYSPPSFAQKGGKPVGNDPHDYNKSWGPSVLKYWNALEAAIA